jgi:hypothetical protein
VFTSHFVVGRRIIARLKRYDAWESNLTYAVRVHTSSPKSEKPTPNSLGILFWRAIFHEEGRIPFHVCA